MPPVGSRTHNCCVFVAEFKYQSLNPLHHRANSAHKIIFNKKPTIIQLQFLSKIENHRNLPEFLTFYSLISQLKIAHITAIIMSLINTESGDFIGEKKNSQNSFMNSSSFPVVHFSQEQKNMQKHKITFNWIVDCDRISLTSAIFCW